MYDAAVSLIHLSAACLVAAPTGKQDGELQVLGSFFYGLQLLFGFYRRYCGREVLAAHLPARSVWRMGLYSLVERYGCSAAILLGMQRIRISCLLVLLAILVSDFSLPAQTLLPERIILSCYGQMARRSARLDCGGQAASLRTMRQSALTTAGYLVIPAEGTRMSRSARRVQIAAWPQRSGMPALYWTTVWSIIIILVPIDDGRRPMRYIRAHAASMWSIRRAGRVGDSLRVAILRRHWNALW